MYILLRAQIDLFTTSNETLFGSYCICKCRCDHFFLFEPVDIALELRSISQIAEYCVKLKRLCIKNCFGIWQPRQARCLYTNPKLFIMVEFRETRRKNTKYRLGIPAESIK